MLCPMPVVRLLYTTIAAVCAGGSAPRFASLSSSLHAFLPHCPSTSLPHCIPSSPTASLLLFLAACLPGPPFQHNRKCHEVRKFAAATLNLSQHAAFAAVLGQDHMFCMCVMGQIASSGSLPTGALEFILLHLLPLCTNCRTPPTLQVPSRA